MDKQNIDDLNIEESILRLEKINLNKTDAEILNDVKAIYKTLDESTPVGLVGLRTIKSVLKYMPKKYSDN